MSMSSTQFRERLLKLTHGHVHGKFRGVAYISTDVSRCGGPAICQHCQLEELVVDLIDEMERTEMLQRRFRELRPVVLGTAELTPGNVEWFR